MNEPSKLVMVIEDEALLLQAITRKMIGSGIECIACSSGKQAIEYLERPGLRPPDVIWLDYYLQDMNGIEFMEYMREKPALAKIPVLVVSNSSSEDNVTHMLALGAQNYILKAEHRLEEIVSMVSKIAVDVQRTLHPESAQRETANAQT